MNSPMKTVETPRIDRARSLYARYGKRFLDLVVGGTAAALLAPTIVGTAAAVRLELGSPILFTQERTGLDGRPFQIVKFRTMTDARGPDGRLLSDSDRLTRFGRFLRESSLDELPELWNVLRGDMSLVGPRPLLHHYMDRYTERQKYRHVVRPGVTGWAAVNGRNTTTWDDRFELDLYYVENLGLTLDLRILFRTLLTVVRRTEIAPTGVDTMPEYVGASVPS